MRRKNTPEISERVNDAETCVGGTRSDAEKAGRTPCITEQSNATDTCIGGATQKAGSILSLGSRQSYKTQEERSEILSMKVFNLIPT